jgi:two-component sensor histidine kinase
MNIADVNFGTRTSVPLALILNELVTNSIKYAFSEGGDGYIKVSLTEQEQEKWSLKVSDSGKGLPEDTGFRANSLGLRLVTIMTKQLKGTLTKSNSPGATFEIAFNLKS